MHTQTDFEPQTQAVIYTRISSVSQSKKGDSLVGQETRCREFALMKNLRVTAVFSDHASPNPTMERSGVTNMLAFLEKQVGSGFVVIVEDVTCITSDMLEFAKLKEALKNRGCRLVTPQTTHPQPATEDFIQNLLTSSAAHAASRNEEALDDA